MKKERTGGKKAEKNERSLVITYLFSRSSLAITLFVTMCFPFPVKPKTFFVCSPFAQKMRENVGVDFFFQILLVCFQRLFLFFVTQSPFPLHQKHLLYVHQLLKKFRENVRVDFLFQILGCFQSLFFVTHPASFCFCYTKNISCMFTNCS